LSSGKNLRKSIAFRSRIRRAKGERGLAGTISMRQVAAKCTKKGVLLAKTPPVAEAVTRTRIKSSKGGQHVEMQKATTV